MFKHVYSIHPDFSVNSALHVMQCGLENCYAGQFYGPVSRDHHLIHFVESGRGTLEMNGKSYSITAGQGFYIPTGMLAKYTSDSNEPWAYCWLGFDGTDSLSALSFRNLSTQYPIFDFSTDSEIHTLTEELLQIYAKNGNDFLTVSYLYRLLSLINPQFSLDHNKNTAFEKLVTYVKDNFQSDISVTKAAEHFSISTSQLFRDFKKYLKMSPQQYIKQYRVFYAAHLLSTTELPISQIAALSGYPDLCNFSKQFKSIYRRSPAAYRKYIDVHADVVREADHSPQD